MTCVINETVVLNTKTNKELFDDNNIVALKADKGKIPQAVEQIMVELGNPSQAIPYYAVYGPGINEPITFAGPITRNQILTAVEQAQVETSENRVASSSEKLWK